MPLVPASGTYAAIGLEANVDYIGGVVVDLAGNVMSDRVVLGDHRRLGSGGRPGPARAPGRRAWPTSPGRRRPRRRRRARRSRGWSTMGARSSGGPAPRAGGRYRPTPCSTWMAGCRRIGGLGLTAGNDADLAAVAETVAHDVDPLTGPNLPRTSPARSASAPPSSSPGSSSMVAMGGAGNSATASSTPTDRRASAAPSDASRSTRAHPRCCRPPGLRSADLPLLGSGAGQELRRAAEAGEPSPSRRWRAPAGPSASAIGDAINLLDVTTVVLGHRYADIADLLRPTLAEAFAHRALSAPWATPEIRASLCRRAPVVDGGSPAGDQRRPGRSPRVAGGAGHQVVGLPDAGSLDRDPDLADGRFEVSRPS